MNRPQNIKGALAVVLAFVLVTSAACGGDDSPTMTAAEKRAAEVGCVDVTSAIQDAQSRLADAEAQDGGEARNKAETASEDIAALNDRKVECDAAPPTTATNATVPASVETEATEATVSGSEPGANPVTDPNTGVAEFADEEVNPVTGLVVVVGGDPANPVVGDEGANTPEVPALAGRTPTWVSLNELAQVEAPWYPECLQKRLGWSAEDLHQSVLHEMSGIDMRYILAVNSTPSDETFKARLTEQGYENVEQLNVVHVTAFENTRRSHIGGPERCESFEDHRSQVRVVLARLIDPNDPSKGLDGDEFVQTGCGNPGRLLHETPPPPKPVTPRSPQRPTPSTQPGPTTPQPTLPVVTTTPATTPPETTPTQTSGPTPTTVPPPTTIPPPRCGDKADLVWDGSKWVCVLTTTTVAPSAGTLPASTTPATPPPTAAPDALPAGVTPTTWDHVPPPVTAQLVEAPPVTDTAPPSSAPPATSATPGTADTPITRPGG